ncbi:hypothetical protein RSOLAG1IB_07685 [Rhizoctonia solani AG-1 IB]|uniref:Uncharacterized protein n=1 Tax=Thanatephorus cucumeris (strain AG1-IB / isolate 7/3/14) TaxID=1108050 RepID=A0A0B7FH54_THACB|nr:hypothetical protein RSOLAG1IB_07685 [Rhizoctonia solani AG-1 IB]
MSDDLHVASELLSAALDKYYDACLALKHSATQSSGLAGQPDIAHSPGPMAMKELSLLANYENKFLKSKSTLLQTANICPALVPVNRLPVDILAHIFQQLVQEEYELTIRIGPHASIPKYPIRLAHVCLKWRWIVLRIPLLWSYITIVSTTQTSGPEFAYPDFHSKYSEQALVEMFIVGLFTIRASNNLHSTTPLDPFFGRVRSLALDLNTNDASAVNNPSAQASWLIAKCLRASSRNLKRLMLFTDTTLVHHPFIESSSSPTNSGNLIVDIPHAELEEVLSPIVDLWLRDQYFNWESKAYHGLTKLQLESQTQRSISESQLIKILESSPQLRYIDIGLDIIVAVTPSPAVHLPELEVIIGDLFLIQLILPGSKELGVYIDWAVPNCGDLLRSDRVKRFFSQSNTVRFYADGLLHSSSDVCYLFSLIPRARELALSFTTISEKSLDIHTGPSLNTICLLGPCAFRRPLLLDMVKKCNVKKLVFYGTISIIGSPSAIVCSEQTLRGASPDLDNTSLEFIAPPANIILSARFLVDQPYL